MTPPLELVLIVHLDLPPGSDRERCEMAWERCYQPILGALHHTPDARAGLVLGGELVQDLREHHPEAIDWIRGLVERGQVELLGTALYGPVLSGIPERDAVGQIRVHAAEVRQAFGVRPAGCWLPHGAWDPAFPRLLAEAGMRWALVRDRDLESVGEPEGSVDGVYRTEREGHCLALLPLDARVLEVAAEVPVRQVVDHLKGRAQRGDALVTVGLYGSRFGLHPGSSPQQDQSWFATLLAAVARARGVLEARLPSEAVALGASRGRIYLPAAPPEGVALPWERFLVRYDPANRLHKKMLRVSRLVQKLDRYLDDDSARLRPDPGQVAQARRYLYRAQASAPYWHHRHAGPYDPAHRERAWRDVLRGEQVALEALGAGERLIVERADLDCDGTDEVLLFTPAGAMVVSPSRGGTVTELSRSSIARNLADLGPQVVEPYHAELGPEDPLRPFVEATPPPRGLFGDRFFGPEATLDGARSGRAVERAEGFAEGLWQVVSAERHGTDAVRTVLHRDGRLRDGETAHRVRLQKRYTLRRRTLGLRQELTNRSRASLVVRHGLELALFLGAGVSEQALVVDEERHPVGRPVEIAGVEVLRLQAADHAIEVQLLQPALLWAFPLHSVHRHLGETTSAVQGLCVLLVHEARVEPGRTLRRDLKLRMRP